MDQISSYRATEEDEHFEAGHYVEAWEFNRLTQLSPSVKELLRDERAVGNKIRSLGKGFVELAQPIGQRLWRLPEGLVFWCPLQEPSIGHYDGDEDGAIVCLDTGTRVFPTGYENEPAHEPQRPPRSAA
jgi:hypothetical protein